MKVLYFLDKALFTKWGILADAIILGLLYFSSHF